MLAFSAVATANLTMDAVEPSEEQCVLDTLTRAFAADPACRWMYPDAQQYRTYFSRFAKAFGGAAFAQGSALASSDRAGAALWLAPGSGPDEAALAEVIESSVPEHRQAEVFALFEEMGRVHPTKPHWYLPLIGVEPSRQGRGLGAALLGPMLKVCDAARLPAYLEATSLSSVPLYRRHGFEPVGEIVAGGCPPIVPMWRVPASGK